MIPAGDVGGTKTLLAPYAGSAGTVSPVREKTFPSREFSSLEGILLTFLAGTEGLQGACFAVAGPVIDGRSRITNVPWELEETRLGGVLNTRMRLLNDLEGAAHGLLFLGPEEREVLQRGVKRGGNMAIIAAGTGLGEAFVSTFSNKGRMADLLTSIEVSVVLTSRLALLGAASVASRL